MNRRDLLKRLGLGLAALPFLGCLRRQERGIYAANPAPTTDYVSHERQIQLQSKHWTFALNTDCLDASNYPAVATAIEQMVNDMIVECRRDESMPESVSLKWVALRGEQPFLRLVCHRWKPGPWEHLRGLRRIPGHDFGYVQQNHIV